MALAINQEPRGWHATQLHGQKFESDGMRRIGVVVTMGRWINHERPSTAAAPLW